MQHREDLEALSAATGPITFVDALLLVRAYRQYGRTDEGFLNGLVTWLDHDCLTTGAQRVLSSLLDSEVRKVRHERSRSQRTLVLADNGRRIRVFTGECITIDLEARDRLGLDWTLVSPGFKESVEFSSDPAKPGVLRVLVTPATVGVLTFSLKEVPGQRWVRPSGHGPATEPRQLTITLVVEAS